jgi:hypothetical protein
MDFSLPARDGYYHHTAVDEKGWCVVAEFDEGGSGAGGGILLKYCSMICISADVPSERKEAEGWTR